VSVPPPRPTLPYAPGLDGLRAISVLAVVAYHLEYAWAAGGFLGVDVFFVLSGFLITSLLLAEWRTRGTVELAAFWARRVRRLLPALGLLLLAVAVYAAVAVPADQLGRLRVEALWSLCFGLNWHFIAAGRSYFDVFAAPSPLRHRWSLAIEEQFYAVWPLLVLGTLRLGRGSRWPLGVLCVIGFGASSALMAVTHDAADPSRAYYGTDTHAFGLLAGGLLAVLLEGSEVRGRAVRLALAVLGTAAALAVLAAFVWVNDRDGWVYHGGLPAFALITALLVAATVSRTPVAAVLAFPPLVAIGRISYGLYLWHWFVQVALTPERTGLDGGLLDAARVAASLAAATASYVLLEQRVRRAKGRPRVALAAAPVAAAAMAGVVLGATSGAVAPAEFYRSPGTEPPEVTVVAEAQGVSPGSRGAPRTVAIVGDSTAKSLVPAYASALGPQGFRVVSATIPGCGLAVLAPVDERGWRLPGSENCPRAVPRVMRGLVRRHNPEFILWHGSRRDTEDRRVGKRVVRFDTLEGDRLLAASMERVRRRLGSRGARIVLVTMVPRWGRVTDTERRIVAHYNRVIRDFVAAHGDGMAMLDMAELICPGGVCLPYGVRPDGIHFTPAASSWVVELMLPDLLAAMR
jgi:peptidoglycan/LPS O-acetylase OafA/YrhL